MGNPIDMPAPDVDISADVAFYWEFFPISSGTNGSEVFNNDDRFVVTQLANATTGDTEYKEEKMDLAGDPDYTDLINDPDVNYLKVELSRGGRSTRTNFHDNALVGSFLVQNNNYFEILGQEGGHIIDVSKRDISQTALFDPRTDPDYILPQEFAWKAVEWHMSNSRTKFFDGFIKTTNISAKRILIRVTGENTATLYGQGYFNLGAREFINFYERFTQQYPHDINSSPRRLYTKYKGWYTYNSKGDKYEIKSVSIQNHFPGTNYDVSLEFTEEPTNFSVGDTVHTLFDRSAIPRKGSFNGSYIVDVSEINPGRGDVNVSLCLDGFWLSPRFDVSIPLGTRLGLCGGRYWGLGDRAPDNENAIIFMRTPAGVLGLSSIYHTVTNEDFVVFYDFDSQNLSIRRASDNFRDLPSKYEISIGTPSNISVASVTSGATSSIALDSSQGRTKIITIDVPPGDEIMLFSVGNINDYYGTIIRGSGEMDLLGFEVSGIPEDSSLYSFRDSPVSPIYEYMKGKYSQTNVREVYLSVDTEDSPIIISNPGLSTPVTQAVVQYVNDNQVINNARSFDLYQINDGELMIFMGRRFRSFLVNNPSSPVTKLSNSSSDGTQWADSDGIFVIGSRDTGIFWGNPVANRTKFENDNQFGLLILDGVNYCCSIYNEVVDEMIIFFVGLLNGQSYLGVFIVSLETLNYENFKCTPQNNDQEFLWRPPGLDPTIYTTAPVEDNFTFDPKTYQFEDTLNIIASESPSINPQLNVTNVTDFGVVSSYVLSDGVMVIFYDSLDGIRFFFSNDSGRNWESSEIIVAKDAKSAIWTKSLLIYITPSSVVSKIITEPLLNTAMEATAGSNATFIESIQKTFDSQIITSLNTGEVPTQQLSAHSDDTGTFHVFYYDANGRLCSTEGTDLGWMDTDNF